MRGSVGHCPWFGRLPFPQPGQLALICISASAICPRAGPPRAGPPRAGPAVPTTQMSVQILSRLKGAGVSGQKALTAQLKSGYLNVILTFKQPHNCFH